MSGDTCSTGLGPPLHVGNGWDGLGGKGQWSSISGQANVSPHLLRQGFPIYSCTPSSSCSGVVVTCSTDGFENIRRACSSLAEARKKPSALDPPSPKANDLRRGSRFYHQHHRPHEPLHEPDIKLECRRARGRLACSLGPED